MANQNQNTSGQGIFEGGVHEPPRSADLGGSGIPSLDTELLSGRPEVSPLAFTSPLEPRPSRFRSLLKPIPVLLATVLIGMLALFAGNLLRGNPQSAGQQSNVGTQYDTQKISLGDFIVSEEGVNFGESSVVINGPLKTTGGFVITPSVQPNAPTAGQLYFDQDTTQLAYYNGVQFVPLGDGVQSVGGLTGQITLGANLAVANGQLVANVPNVVAVNSLAGQTGAITLGSGLAMSGNALQNSGILNVIAGSNIGVSNDGNGNVTITNTGSGTGTVTSGGGTVGRLPLFTAAQNIEDSLVSQSGLTVTVNGDLSVVTGGLSLSNALTVSNGGTGATSLAANGVIVGNGTSALSSVTAGGAGLCLLSTAGAPSWSACPGGGGVSSLNSLTGGLSIANASGAGSTITIDNASTSAKGIAQFNATNFSASAGTINTIQDINTGATPTFAGVNTNSITPSSTLTVGASGQTLILQGDGGTVLTATDSSNTTTVAFTTPSADVTINVPALSVGTYDFCTTSGNCLGGGGGGANTALSNLTGVAINTTLLPGAAGGVHLGSGILPFGDLFLAGSSGTPGTNNFRITGASTSGTRIITLPDATGTVCLTTGNCSGAGGGVTTSGGTIGTLPVFTAAQIIGDSLVSQSGGTVTVNGHLSLAAGNQFQVNGTQISSANLSNDSNLAKLNASQTFTGTSNAFQNGSNSTNAFNVQNAAGTRILTVDTSNGEVELGLGSTLDGKLVFFNVSNNNTVTIEPGTPSSPRTITLPDEDGTVCLDSGNCAGAGATLQTAYNFSAGGTTPKIKLNSTLNGVEIQDADTTIGADLFTVRESNGAGLGQVMFGVGNTGQVTLQNGANSTTAFRLLTDGGTSVVTGDTQNGQILLGQGGTLTGTLVFSNDANSNQITLTAADASGPQTATLPDATGEICLSVGNCSGTGSTNTLQAAYDAGNTIDTATARDIEFNLTEQAVDSNFLVDLQCDTTCGGNGRFAIQDDGTDVFTVSPAGGAVNFINAANSTQAFNVETQTGGNLFTIDTSNSRVGIALGSNNTPNLTNQGLEVNGAIRISGSANDTYTTPNVLGAPSNITARLSVVNSVLASGQQVIALGVTDNSDATARGITVADARAGAHQPSLAVLSPDDNQIGGFSWDGSTTAFLIKNSASGSIGLNIGGTTQLSVNATSATFAEGADRTINVTNRSTNAAGNSLTLQAANAGAGASAFNGGNLTLQAGNAAGTGNADGGTVTILAGNDIGSGETGQVIIQAGSGDRNEFLSVRDSSNNPLLVVNSQNGQLYLGEASVSVGYDITFGDDGTDRTIGVDDSSTADGDDLTIRAGSTTATNGDGGSVILTGGDADGAGVNGIVLVRNVTDSAGSFRVQNAAGTETMLSVDTTARSGSGGNLVKIGNSTGTDGDLTILQLDATANPNPSSNLSALNGGLFYNSTTNKVSLIENGQIKIICNTTDLGCGTGTVTLQSAYGNGTGGATSEIIVDNTRGAVDIQDRSTTNGGTIGANLLNVRATAANDSTAGTLLFGVGNTGAVLSQNSVNSQTAFQIQNSTGSSIFNVSTLNSGLNLIVNSSFESNLNGWAAKGTPTGGTPVRNNTAGNSLFGASTLNVDTNDTGDGVQYAYKFLPSTQYTASFYMKRSSGSLNYMIGRQENGSDVETGCSASTVTTTWTQFTCTFTTGATINDTSNLYVRADSSTASTIYIDGVTLVQGATALAYNAGGNNIQVDAGYNNLTLNGANSGELQAWQSTSQVTAARSRAATVTYNGFIYALGGGSTADGDTVASSNNVQYAKINADGTLGSFTNNASNLSTAVAGAGAAVLNGYVYIVGGKTGNADTTGVATVQYAILNKDGSTGTWQTTTALPNSRHSLAVVTYNGYIYAFGGFDSTGTTQGSVYYAKVNADGTITSWSTGTSLPAGYAPGGATASVANGYVYVMGGQNSGASTHLAYSKLGATGTPGTWGISSSSDINPLPTSLVDMASTVMNGYLYVFGGNTGSRSSAVYYTPIYTTGQIGSWVTAASSLPAGRDNMDAVTVNGYTYIVAGDESATRQTVLYVSGHRLKVASALDLVGVGGSTLNEGATGGQLTAGDTNVIGKLRVQEAAEFVADIFVGGNATFRNVANSTSAFAVLNATGVPQFSIDTTNSRVYVGNPTSDTTGALLVLDTKSDAGDPGSAVNGSMYYNSNSQTFRCYEDSVWYDCLSRHKIVLGSDVADSAGNCTGYATAFTLPVTSGKVYNFMAQISYTSASSIVGSEWTINGPTATFLAFRATQMGTNDQEEFVFYGDNYDEGACTANTINNTASLTWLEGMVTTSSSGNLLFQFATETNGTAITAKAGSTLEWW